MLAARMLIPACAVSARLYPPPTPRSHVMQLRGGEAVECRDSWQGPFRFPDGATYYGEVTDGRICGQGEWRSAKGDCYFGSFRDDVFHGRGMYMEASGSTVEGTFELGRLCGPGTYWLTQRLYLCRASG